MTGLLARQLLDTSTGDVGGITTGGFNWIASNPEVLEAWLSILRGEGRPISAFLTVIPIADAQTIDNFITHHTRPGEESILPNVDNAKEFIQWLRTGIANNSISVNQVDSFLHITPDGILILDGAYKQFSQATNFASPEGIEREFRQYIELYQETVGDIAQRYTGIQGISLQNFKRYLIVHNSSLLYAMGQQPPSTYSNYVVLQNADVPQVTLPPVTPPQRPQVKPTA